MLWLHGRQGRFHGRGLWSSRDRRRLRKKQLHWGHGGSWSRRRKEAGNALHVQNGGYLGYVHAAADCVCLYEGVCMHH